MRVAILLVVVALAACAPQYDSPWLMRAGISAQPIARERLGIADTAAVQPGNAWIALRSYDGSDVVYPVVVDETGGLRVESPFDPAIAESHGALVTSTRLSRDAEPAEEHPTVQYATLFVEATVAPLLRDAAHAGGATALTVELDVHVPSACLPPPPSVAGTVEGCLSGGGTTCDESVLARRDGLYQTGPIAMTIEVLGQECAAE
jgi:hypothetical protein